MALRSKAPRPRPRSGCLSERRIRWSTRAGGEGPVSPPVHAGLIREPAFYTGNTLAPRGRRDDASLHPQVRFALGRLLTRALTIAPSTVACQWMRPRMDEDSCVAHPVLTARTRGGCVKAAAHAVPGGRLPDGPGRSGIAGRSPDRAVNGEAFRGRRLPRVCRRCTRRR